MTTVPPTPVSTADGTAAAFSPSDWATFSAIGLIWGASFLFIAVGLESLEPGLITSLRVSLGAITLALLPGSQIRLQAEDRLRMVALSIVWVGVPFTSSRSRSSTSTPRSPVSSTAPCRCSPPP